MEMLSRKRPADDAASENKRFKNAIEESAAEFLCPITQELPLDPVMAEDGHVYERTAIAEWLAKGNGKSPSTNELMGSKLLPALQVKNLISSMVKSGALSGDYVESWQQRIDEEQEAELRDICALNDEAMDGAKYPTIVELPEADCWTIGEPEARLRQLQTEYQHQRRSGPHEPASCAAAAHDMPLERVRLRDLFAASS